MANDRVFIRCLICGDYERFGKYYPSHRSIIEKSYTIASFIERHIFTCQKPEHDLGDSMPFVIDNETSLVAAGGLIGGRVMNINQAREIRAKRERSADGD